MGLIILLILFVVVMLLWFLSLVGQHPAVAVYSPWLAFLAVAILGAVVFLYSPSPAWRPGP